MAVLSNAMWRVHPGRTTEFMSVGREAKEIHERLGARAFLVQWSNAGSNSGAFGYGLLFADLAAWGRFVDALPADAAWQAWVTKNLDIPDPVATLLSQTVASDQPGFEAPDPAVPGTFVLGANGQLSTGRTTADAYRLIADVKSTLLELGAQWVRFRRVIIGGEATLTFVTTMGFANAASYGEWQMKFAADPRGQAFLQAAFGPGSALSGITQATGRVLAL